MLCLQSEQCSLVPEEEQFESPTLNEMFEVPQWEMALCMLIMIVTFRMAVFEYVLLVTFAKVLNAHEMCWASEFRLIDRHRFTEDAESKLHAMRGNPLSGLFFALFGIFSLAGIVVSPVGQHSCTSHHWLL